MRKINVLLLLSVFLLINFKVEDRAVTKEDRKKAAEYLKKTREDLLKSIKGLTPEQLSFKASPESWSVAECVEHLAISENNLFGLVQGTLKEAADPSKRSLVKQTDDGIFNMITDRTYKVKTQEAFVPTGKFGTHQATVKEFVTKRNGTIKYILSTKDDLRNHFFTFPVEALGTLDSYQILIFMAGHSKRHTLQIEEVKSNAGFPKKK